MAIAGKLVINEVGDKKHISLENLKGKITTEDPRDWGIEVLKKSLSLLTLSVSGTKEELSKRICNLKKHPSLLDKLITKQTKGFTFQSRLYKSYIPTPEAKWLSDSSFYPKVNFF